MEHSDLGKRMKTYESVSRHFLMRRTPVIIRLDGKAFHTLTRGFDKPFDKILMQAMQETMHCLAQEVQGCVFGYTQSDEITLVLTDYKELNTNAYFDYNVQKLTSVCASIATREFIIAIANLTCNDEEKANKYFNKLANVAFDCRAFNIPVSEVCNNLVWRQLDCIRNSKQMVAQANFSQKELQKKSCKKLVEMLKEKGIEWDAFPVDCQRGSSVYKNNGQWVMDTNIPVFTENRDFIEKHLDIEKIC